MKKRLVWKILIWTFSIAVFVLAGAYFAMDYAIHKVLHMVAVDVSQKSTTGTQTPSTIRETQQVLASPTSVDPLTTMPATETPKATPKPASKSGETGDAETRGVSPTPYVGSISNEKAAKAEQQITLEEKAKLTSTLLKKLSADDIALFTKMMSDGLTIDEKREAKKKILQKLSEDEYNELIQIAVKLGLSQGEDYKNSVKGLGIKK